MIWLTNVLMRIEAKREVYCAAREKLRQIAGELSGICDQHVPLAPAPHYDIFPDEEDRSVWCGSLGWFWVEEHRTLHVQVAAEDEPTLLMLHGASRATLDRFDHERLKSSVVAFFDGWRPPVTHLLPWTGNKVTGSRSS